MPCARRWFTSDVRRYTRVKRSVRGIPRPQWASSRSTARRDLMSCLAELEMEFHVDSSKSKEPCHRGERRYGGRSGSRTWKALQEHQGTQREPQTAEATKGEGKGRVG